MYSWTAELDSTPLGDHHRAVVVGHKVYSFGGFFNMHTCMTIDEVHVFNTVSLRWTTLPLVTASRGQCPPNDICRFGCHAPVLIHHTVYIPGIFHGYGEDHFVLYAFDVETHGLFLPQVSGDVPPVNMRCYSGVSAVVLGQVMYVWLTGYDSGKMCRLDTVTMVWSSINAGGTPAPISQNHTFANIIGTKIYLVGDGCNSSYYRNQNADGGRGLSLRCYLSVFDVETNCWLGSPFALDYTDIGRHECVVAYNGELYVLGIKDPLKEPFITKQVWKFNPGTFTWKRIQTRGNDPCTSTGICCCVVGDRIVVFGGHGQFAHKLYILDMKTSLKALCKLLVIQYGLEQSELPHNLRWELAAMTTQEE